MQIEEYKTKLEKNIPDGVKLEIKKDTLIVNINSKDKSTNIFYLLNNNNNGIAKIPYGINTIIIETNDTVTIPAEALHNNMCIKVKGNLEIGGDLKLFGNEDINFIVSGDLIVTSTMFPTHFDAIISGDFHLIAPVLPSGVYLRAGGSLFLPVTQFLPTVFECAIGGDLHLMGFEGKVTDLMTRNIILREGKKIFLRDNINKEVDTSNIEEKKEMITYIAYRGLGGKYHVCFMDNSESIYIPDQGVLMRWTDGKSKETYIKAIFNSGKSLFGKLEGKEGNEKVCMYTISPLSSYAHPNEFLVTYWVNYDGMNETYEMYNTYDHKEAIEKQEEYMRLVKGMNELAPCCECTPNM